MRADAAFAMAETVIREGRVCPAEARSEGSTTSPQAGLPWEAGRLSGRLEAATLVFVGSSLAGVFGIGAVGSALGGAPLVFGLRHGMTLGLSGLSFVVFVLCRSGRLPAAAVSPLALWYEVTVALGSGVSTAAAITPRPRRPSGECRLSASGSLPSR